jgi:uncharacterized protein (DUF1800 family)
MRNFGKRRQTCFGVLGAAALLLTPISLGYGAPAQMPKTKATTAKQKEPKVTEDDRIVHVLNRLGFGPRPDDIDRVKQMGLHAYIEQQLHPDQIDDSAVERKLQGYAELNLSDSEIEARYNQFINADQAQARLRRQLAKAAAEKTATTDVATTTQPGAQGNPQANQQAVRDMLAGDPNMQREFLAGRDQLVKVAEPIGLIHEEFDAAKLIRAVESQRQLQEVLVDFWSNHFNIDIRKAPCGVLKVLDDRDVIRPHIWGKFRDLLEASAKSPAMLVYLDNYQSVADQLPNPNVRRRARRNAPFVGTVGEPPPPQMTVANPPPPPPPRATPRRKVGLNENYAREIMELHTLGVDGGYTQQDVHEVARCFTGWSVAVPDGLRARAPRYGEAGEFMFRPFVHDNGEKVVLGHHIPPGGGMRDGEIVLSLLAEDRATWRHLSYQLCQRLVSDEPPTSLVDKCVQTWQNTDGDLREVVRTIVTSPEFFSPQSLRKKIKSPFEYAVSSVRALNGTLDPELLVSRRQIPREANSLVRPPQGGGFLDLSQTTLLGQIGTMGEPIFQYQAPTGFPEDSRKWVSAGALISRLNFSLALTQGRIADVKLDDPAEDAGGTIDANAMIDRASNRILHGQISPSTRATLLREANADTGSRQTPATIAALLLGSPEFQRR